MKTLALLCALCALSGCAVVSLCSVWSIKSYESDRAAEATAANPARGPLYETIKRLWKEIDTLREEVERLKRNASAQQS